MAFKLRTSKRTDEILRRLETTENLPCYALVKLAIALSLRVNTPLQEDDFHTNTLGRELNRQTITGDTDTLYKCVMQMYAGKHLSDEDFFPSHVKAHIDRGAILLDQEQRYGRNFLEHLAKLDKAL